VANNELALAFQLKENLKEIGEFLVIELSKELKAQGHIATGKLKDSIEYEIAGLKGELELAISYLEYGAVVERGVSASRIPYGGGKGSVSKYIQGLMSWIRFKKLTSGLAKDVKSFAFAIAKTHKKDGMPSKGSYKFSNNGRRKFWQLTTINDNAQKIENLLSKDIDVSIQATLNDVLNKISFQFGND
jgi:hypothetical protein